MDWNRTKTILILTFLVFNIFLASDLFNKQTELSDLEQYEQVTIEDQLKNLNVTYEKNLPVQTEKMSFISGDVHEFTEQEEKTLEEGTSQDITLDGRKLISTLKKPFPISDPDESSAFSIFLETYVYEGGKYQFYARDEKNPNIIYFAETFEDRPIYSQDSGMLIVTLEDDKVVSYTQTYLNLKEIGKERKIDPASETIGLLVNQQDISLNDKVEDMSIGYYTTVTNEDDRDTFVFVPTWHVVVKNENKDKPIQNYYVNAIEKTVFSDPKEVETNEQEDEKDSDDSEKPDPSKPKTVTSDK